MWIEKFIGYFDFSIVYMSKLTGPLKRHVKVGKCWIHKQRNNYLKTIESKILKNQPSEPFKWVFSEEHLLIGVLSTVPPMSAMKCVSLFPSSSKSSTSITSSSVAGTNLPSPSTYMLNNKSKFKNP